MIIPHLGKLKIMVIYGKFMENVYLIILCHKICYKIAFIPWLYLSKMRPRLKIKLRQNGQKSENDLYLTSNWYVHKNLCLECVSILSYLI